MLPAHDASFCIEICQPACVWHAFLQLPFLRGQGFECRPRRFFIELPVHVDVFEAIDLVAQNTVFNSPLMIPRVNIAFGSRNVSSAARIAAIVVNTPASPGKSFTKEAPAAADTMQLGIPIK